MTEPVVSRATLDELAGSTDREFVRELIDTYLDDSPRLLAEMRQGLAENQPGTVQRAAHSFKSNSASLGAHSLSAHANDLAKAPAKIDQLAALYAQVESELHTWKSE